MSNSYTRNKIENYYGDGIGLSYTSYHILLNLRYAAPGTQSVNSKFSISWGTYLASRKDIIYGMIDGRGSGFQGEKIKHEVSQRD